MLLHVSQLCGWGAAGAWLDKRQDADRLDGAGRGVAGQAVGGERRDMERQLLVSITSDVNIVIITTSVCF